MNIINIAIGTDHRGFKLKEFLISQKIIGKFAITWHDVGTHNCERTDYPLFVPPVINLIDTGQVNSGILICGSGIGMSIAANRFKKIYAGLVWNATVARLAKEDDNVNVLILPSDFITCGESLDIISAWLSASFKGEIYAHRISMIDKQ